MGGILKLFDDPEPVRPPDPPQPDEEPSDPNDGEIAAAQLAARRRRQRGVASLNPDPATATGVSDAGLRI